MDKAKAIAFEAKSKYKKKMGSKKNKRAVQNKAGRPDPLVMPDFGAHTTVNVRSGGLAVRQNVIDGLSVEPIRTGLRYSLTHWMLGKLERLAKARFTISEITGEDLEDWQKSTETVNWNIAQSVNASSEIEGESVHASKLEILQSPATEPVVGAVDKELQTRLAAIKSIYETYLWMLCSRTEPVISYELILECHRRMFASTKGDKAGQLKTKPVHITGGTYYIETLPPKHTEEFLRAAVAEFNRRWDLSRKYAEYSRFLLICEFVIDFLAIHPFDDGNGRTARLLSTYLLEKAGYHFTRFYPVDTIILETRREYYDALYTSQLNWHRKEEDLTPWVDYYVSTIFTQWMRAYERVKEAYLHKSRNKIRP